VQANGPKSRQPYSVANAVSRGTVKAVVLCDARHRRAMQFIDSDYAGWFTSLKFEFIFNQFNVYRRY